jgi:hypothetical protein
MPVSSLSPAPSVVPSTSLASRVQTTRSFADVFLITPSVVGGQTGLSTSPHEVVLMTFEAVDVFLDTKTSEEEKGRRLRGIGREVREVSKSIGKPGEVLYQELVPSGLLRRLGYVLGYQ